MTAQTGTWDRMRANHAAINQVPCPHCKAAPHVRCRGPKGLPQSIPHQARRHAAAVAGLYVPGGAA